MMITGDLRVDYALDRQREALREAERRRLWRGEGRQASKAIETVRQTFEQFAQWYNRQGVLCLDLDPACEMPYV